MTTNTYQLLCDSVGAYEDIFSKEEVAKALEGGSNENI